MTTNNNIQTRGLPGTLRSSLPWRAIFCGGVLNVFAEEIQPDSGEGKVLLLLAFFPDTSKLVGSFPAPLLFLAGTPDHRRRQSSGADLPRNGRFNETILSCRGSVGFSTKTKKQGSILNNIFLGCAKQLIRFNFFALPRDFKSEIDLLSNTKVTL